MGSAFYRIKVGLYVFVIIMVGILFGVRVYNTFQKTTYLTTPIFEDSVAQISLSHPIRILSPRNETSYPLTLAFVRNNDALPLSRTYTVTLESPTLLFLDARGTEVTPLFQFTDAGIFAEQSIYVRPYLSEFYPQRHVITMHVIEEQIATIHSSSIEIQTEPGWFSIFSLAASSLLEISIASALIAWIANAIDVSSTARKERVAKIREVINGLPSLSYLEQMDKVYKLEDEVKNENLDDDIGEEIQRVKYRFAEEKEFFRSLGEQSQQGKSIDFLAVRKLHNRFYLSGEHEYSMEVLEKTLGQESILQETALQHISAIMKLWDGFDADAKDLIIGALKRLDQKNRLSDIPQNELLKHIFYIPNRRRLLRDVEIRMLFPQLVNTALPPVGYDAAWRYLPQPVDDSKILLEWLGQHAFAFNPFGASIFKNYPILPEGTIPPDQWSDFLNPIPYLAHCPTPEDARALAFQLRIECLPTKKKDAEGNETVTGQKVFPVLVSFNQSSHLESPLLTIVRSAAQTWLDILCLSPDAMLDLLPAEQEALLEFLCWAFGSPKTVINLLQREGLKPESGGRLLAQKIEQFQSGFSSTQLPQNAILLSWLKIRPPDLNSTYLILPLDEIPTATKMWWLEQFSPLISTLFLNGMITKAFSSSPISVSLTLSETQLNWSDQKLKTSLNSQFDAAMDKDEQRKMGQVVDFRSLFGFDSSIGYFESKEDTTDKLISASHNSLARLLMLGNRLLETHCAQEVPTPYLSVAELEAILKSA